MLASMLCVLCVCKHMSSGSWKCLWSPRMITGAPCLLPLSLPITALCGIYIALHDKLVA